MLQLAAKQTPDYSSHREAQLRQKRFQLAKLLRCTEDMLHCAQSGDWEAVEVMENSRKKELAACFLDRGYDDSSLIAEALATLIYLNEQITSLVKQAKSEVIEQQINLQDGKSAARNYQNYQENTEAR